MDIHILIWGGGKIFGGGGAFSSKLIQSCLNTKYNSEFRYNWGGGAETFFGGGAKHLGGGGAKNIWGVRTLSSAAEFKR